MWKGSISFGLVNIPVSLYKATDDHKTSFRSLHEECKHPIQYRKWCPVCNREVEQKEIIRGYEYAKGNYIIISDDDIKNLPLPTLRTIEILHFTDQDSIDPIYYEKTYYLGPGEYGGKPYKLLYQAMKETGKIAVAKVAFRTSEHLSVIRLHKDCLVLNIIHYPAEIRSVEGVPGIDAIAGTEVTENELQMATRLIEEISESFRNDYQSNYEEALKELIESKIQNKEVEEPEAERASNVVDLMEALQQSLKQGSKKKANPQNVAAGGEQDGTAANTPEPKRRRRKI